MKTRIISGAVLTLLTIGVFVLGGPTMLVVQLLLSCAGYFELVKALGYGVKSDPEKARPKYRPFLYAGEGAIVVWYILLFFFPSKITTGSLGMYYLIGCMFMFAILCVALYPKRWFDDAALSLMGVVYTGILLSCVYLVRQADKGQFFVWFIIWASWGADTCAYFTGRFLGKHKMSPKLSPKKTVEGAIGGIVGAIVLSLIYGLIVAGSAQIELGVMARISLLIGLIGSIVSEVGDLFASSIKRVMKIKDYSKLIPGHGGILDRFDSVILVAPVIVVILKVFGVAL